MSTTTTKTQLECYFEEFRKDIIGNQSKISITFWGKENHLYHWTASGRLYRPIEEKLMNDFGPLLPIRIPKLQLQEPQ